MSEKTVGILLVVLLVLGSFAIGFGPELMRSSERKRLLREGAPAQATITALTDTGNRQNDDPEVRLSLRIEVEGSAPWTAEVVLFLGVVELQNYVVGATLPVRYDPKDPAKVALAGPPTPPPSNSAP